MALYQTSSRTQNLVFAQETRRQIARQSRIYPNLLSAIFTGNSTPYIRLISGLGWFFFIFVMTSLAISGIALAVWNVMGFAAAFDRLLQTVCRYVFCNFLCRPSRIGHFSGLVDVTKREDANRIYFYMAIAFVAGFSDRLVRDVVIKTEDTLAGPSSQDK